MYFQVLDHVISDRYSQYLFENLHLVPWTFVPNISVGQGGTDSPGFSFNFYLHKKLNHKEPIELKSAEYNLIVPMYLECFSKFGINVDIKNIVRSRSRLTLHKETSSIDTPHIDYKFNHLVLLYYINTIDGDTVFFDKDEKIVERITPRRGRAVLFDGSILHASSNPTLGPRIVINTNIINNIENF